MMSTRFVSGDHMNATSPFSIRRWFNPTIILSGAGALVAVGLRLPDTMRPRHPIAFAASVFGAAGLASSAATRPPTVRRVVANLATAAFMFLVSVLTGARAAALGHPALLVVLTGLVLLNLYWSGLDVWRHRQALARCDSFQSRTERVLSFFVSPMLARFASAEATVIRFAFAVRYRPHIPVGATGFSYHRNGVLVLIWTVVALSCVEAFMTHVLISRWNGAVALALTLLVELSVVYLLGIANSLHRLPILIDANSVRLRMGVLIDHRVELSDIESVEMIRGPDHSPGLRLSGLSSPNVQLVLKRPAAIRRLLKPGQASGRLDIYVDDAAGFCEAVCERVDAGAR